MVEIINKTKYKWSLLIFLSFHCTGAVRNRRWDFLIGGDQAVRGVEGWGGEGAGLVDLGQLSASRMRLFYPSAVAPCSVGVQYAGEVSPRLLIQPKLYPCTFSRSSVLK